MEQIEDFRCLGTGGHCRGCPTWDQIQTPDDCSSSTAWLDCPYPGSLHQSVCEGNRHWHMPAGLEAITAAQAFSSPPNTSSSLGCQLIFPLGRPSSKCIPTRLAAWTESQCARVPSSGHLQSFRIAAQNAARFTNGEVRASRLALVRA